MKHLEIAQFFQQNDAGFSLSADALLFNVQEILSLLNINASAPHIDEARRTIAKEVGTIQNAVYEDVNFARRHFVSRASERAN